MGTPDTEVAGADRADDLCRARDQGHHAFGMSIGHLARCYRPVATETRKRGRGLVVRPLADRNDVVLTERPIKVFDGDAALLSHLLEGLRPADRFLNVADA
jgi:hypothetical protein